MSTKSRKITVLLEPNAFERFELYCDEKGFKKSTLISKLISDYLDKEAKTSEKLRDKK